MKINDFNIFVINLLKRTDRMEKFEQEASRIGFKYTRVDAVETNDGVSGCRLSHINIAKKAREKRLENYLVFEDDAQFHDNFNSLFNDAISKVPEWDILLLGGNHQGGYNYQDFGVVRVFGSYTTHAMAVSSKFYDAFIEALENTDLPCDVALANLHKQNNVYAFHPSLVWQRDGFSDIEKKEVKYEYLR